LAFDQGVKRSLYARHGVAEYWIIDVEGKRIQVLREPDGQGAYAQTLAMGLTETVAPHEFPQARLSVQSLFT
jgi:Uma2 family endonuclease